MKGMGHIKNLNLKLKIRKMEYLLSTIYKMAFLYQGRQTPGEVEFLYIPIQNDTTTTKRAPFALEFGS